MQEDNDDLDFLQKVDTIHINDTVYINECDTVVLNNYINDTVYINECDTVVLNNYINDTVYINECDTVVLNNYIYDTLYINKYDTVLVNNYLYDTIYLNKYIKDTIYISKKINSLDTVLISEKNVVNEQIAFPNIEFETNKYEIRSTSLKVLMKLYNLLNTNPFLKVKIQAHTDNVGDAVANIQLSRDRAESVKNFLINKGIMSDRIIALYYGENKPLYSNDTKIGRSKNRRVEIKTFVD